MPTILHIPLQVDKPPSFPPVHLPQIFLDCLAEEAPSLVNHLREAAPPRPYTLSRFYRRDDRWFWRVTLLRDDLEAPLQAGLERLKMLPIPEESIPVEVSKVTSQTLSYEGILAQAADARHMRLQFFSPTSFRTGLVSYTLPDPMVAFQSWWRRWNAFAPSKFNRVLLDVAAVHLAVARHRIRTEVVGLGVGKMIGFIGNATFRVIQAHKLGDDIVRHLNALADYAVYCGTGQRTAQGMGQTRRYD
jgi:CRISPR-associated endoribonuclease Cas6